MKVSHLVPKADPLIEKVIANPWGLFEMIKWLKNRGVQWTEPETPLTQDELRTVVRVLYREMRMRENSPDTSAITEDKI